MAKKDFIKALHHLYAIREIRGVILFDRELLQMLVHDSIATRLQYYRRSYIVQWKNLNVVLMEVKAGTNQFKILPANYWGEISKHSWHFHNGNLCGKIDGREMTVERFVWEINHVTDCDYEIHHKWYRAVAVEELIIGLTKDDHDSVHAGGNGFRRSQGLILKNRSDFDLFLDELLKAINEKQNRRD